MMGFQTTSLASVCDISMGQAPKGESYNTSGEGYPLIAGAGDFGETTPSPGKWTVSPTKLSVPGDIILCIRATIGDLNWSDKEYCIGRGVAGLRSRRAKLDQNYLWHWLSFSADELKAKGRGATFLQVSKADIGSLQIPLPPLAEQKRIAAILDAADALRAKRRESLAQLDILLQSTFLDMFGDPVKNSKQLPQVQLGELGNWQSGGTPPRSKPDYFDGDILWFSSGELNDLYASSSKEKVSQKAILETSVKAVSRNALMLGMYDTAALKASIAGAECSCNQAIAFSKINETKANVLYVYFAILIGREEFRRLQRGVRQKNLNLSMVKQIPIPLPAVTEQHYFANIVESVELQKARLRQHLAELDTLFASLQHRAFNGDL